ncbi:MAG: 50S ribosomal protein L11 [Candidatus Pacebacteria bacterium]|nr:50S ribosomal protein L11 [Candidatus Paceibacterota bacterium]
MKKVTKFIKVQIEAGQAKPAPPLGPALGQAGINIAEFTKKFNDETKDKKGPLSTYIYSFEDKSYEYVIKTPTTTSLIKAAAGIQKGSVKPGSTKGGKISKASIKAIAEQKMPDLTANDTEQAMRIIEGSARSMGLEVIA